MWRAALSFCLLVGFACCVQAQVSPMQEANGKTVTAFQNGDTAAMLAAAEAALTLAQSLPNPCLLYTSPSPRDS